VSLAIMVSQLRRVVASQSEMEVQSVDDELMALSAKHQESQFPKSMIALILSIFAVIGGMILSFDVQDAHEEEAAEPCVDEPPKEDVKVEGDEQQSEAQSAAMWPCTPFHLRGLMHSAIVVGSVVILAFVVSQLRRVVALFGLQLFAVTQMEASTAHDELMALSTKHQDCYLSGGVTALILSSLAVLGGAVFSFYMKDALEEEAQ